jgi:hypothetical protein
LGLLPASCSVYRKKGYYSRDRDREIVLDVSIELTLPGATNWSILWAWECKDYLSHVPASDLEEFWAKLQQIGGVNVKGGFATTAALQQGAMCFAKSKGISVVRLFRNDQVDWELEFLTAEKSMQLGKLDNADFQRAFTDQTHRGKNRTFYASSGDRIFGNWVSLLNLHTKEMEMT